MSDPKIVSCSKCMYRKYVARHWICDKLKTVSGNTLKNIKCKINDGCSFGSETGGLG